MLIKRTSDFHYFKDSIAEERLRIELTWDYGWNMMIHSASILPTGSQYYSFSYFDYTLYTIGSMLGVTLVYGLLYEVRRRRGAYKQPNEQVDTASHRLEIYAAGQQLP